MEVKTRKVRLIVDINCETGKWDIEYKNIGDKGCGMDYSILKPILKAIFIDHDNQLIPNTKKTNFSN